MALDSLALILRTASERLLSDALASVSCEAGVLEAGSGGALHVQSESRETSHRGL